MLVLTLHRHHPIEIRLDKKTVIRIHLAHQNIQNEAKLAIEAKAEYKIYRVKEQDVE